MMFYYYKLLLNEYYVNKMNFLQKLQWGLQIKYVFFESQLALFTKQSHNKGFQLLRTQRETKVITVVQDCVPQIFRVFFVFSQQFFFFLICRHSLHILGIQLTLEQLWGVKNPCTTQTICIPGSTSALTICILVPHLWIQPTSQYVVLQYLLLKKIYRSRPTQFKPILFKGQLNSLCPL